MVESGVQTSFQSTPLSSDLITWRADLARPAGLARATQQRINRIIPERVHAAITAAIEGMTRA